MLYSPYNVYIQDSSHCTLLKLFTCYIKLEENDVLVASLWWEKNRRAFIEKSCGSKGQSRAVLSDRTFCKHQKFHLCCPIQQQLATCDYWPLEIRLLWLRNWIPRLTDLNVHGHPWLLATILDSTACKCPARLNFVNTKATWDTFTFKAYLLWPTLYLKRKTVNIRRRFKKENFSILNISWKGFVILDQDSWMVTTG